MSVNDVLQALESIDGCEVAVKGVLSFEFENVSIAHAPPSEQREGYSSSIWLNLHCRGESETDLRLAGVRLNGEPVVVVGALRAGRRSRRGCGHMGLWPAEILVSTIVRQER